MLQSALIFNSHLKDSSQYEPRTMQLQIKWEDPSKTKHTNFHKKVMPDYSELNVPYSVHKEVEISKLTRPTATIKLEELRIPDVLSLKASVIMDKVSDELRRRLINPAQLPNLGCRSSIFLWATAALDHFLTGQGCGLNSRYSYCITFDFFCVSVLEL